MKMNKEGYIRKRNKYVNFRVTPEEYDLINRYVALSGLKKQEYITANMLKQTIVVKGNPKVFKSLKKEMNLILEELIRIENNFDLSKVQMEFILYAINLCKEMNIK